MFSHVEYSFNFFENCSTDVSSFEALYGIKPRDLLLRIIQKDQNQSSKEVNFLKTRKQLCLDVINSVKITQTKIIILWDKNHHHSNLTRMVYIKIAKASQLEYYISEFSSLTAKKADPFYICRKVKNLAYKLNLSSNIKIYSVIFVIYLKHTKSDEFERENSFTLTSKSIIVKGKSQWVVD